MIDARPLILILAAFAASPALSQGLDGVISTGASVAAPMTTDQKIANLLAAAKQDDIARAGRRVEIGPRQTRGEVGAAVGSDGYRSAHVQAVIPIGESGALSVAYGQSRGGLVGFGPAYGGPGYGAPGYDGSGYARRDGAAQSLNLGFAFDASRDRATCMGAQRDGGRPVEPVWAGEMRGRANCEPARAD